MSSPNTRPAPLLYRTLWRWHFYAALLVLPAVLVLALSGTVFLFKPQIERWEERAFTQLSQQDGTAPAAQVEAALAAFPGADFHSYRLPERSGDAALVHVSLPDGAMRDVFVAPDGQVAGSLDAGWRITEVARRIHSQLLMGPRASPVVELAACWAIVMLLTGLYLWWPRGRGAAGVVWPRRAALLRDLHAVTGFWVSALAMVLLLTGLPWTDVWGGAFQRVRAQMGWVQGAPQWSTGDAAHPATHADAHAAHHHDAMEADGGGGYALALLDDIVPQVAAARLAYPAIVLAPDAARFGVASPDWVATSNTQNRPLGATLQFHRDSGALASHSTFAAQHPIDRVIGYGLAWHEGALFGVFNQLAGVATALALVTLCVTGFLMWRRRRPAGALGAPPPVPGRRIPPGLIVALLVLAALLPLLAASLVVLWLFDLLLPRISPAAGRWLGITAR